MQAAHEMKYSAEVLAEVEAKRAGICKSGALTDEALAALLAGLKERCQLLKPRNEEI